MERIAFGPHWARPDLQDISLTMASQPAVSRRAICNRHRVLAGPEAHGRRGNTRLAIYLEGSKSLIEAGEEAFALRVR